MSKVLVVLALAGCASAKSDAQPHPAHEVVSGAGRIHGGGVRMDVTVGRAMAATPTSNATVTAKPVTTVAP